MKIDIRKIVQPLPLRDYDPAYEDVQLQVWVNPPKELTNQRVEHLSKSGALVSEMKAFLEMGKEAQEIEDAKTRMHEIAKEMATLSAEMTAWLAGIWSQGDEATRMSAEDLTEFVKDCDESDPMLYAWLVDRTLTMISDYRYGKKKV